MNAHERLGEVSNRYDLAAQEFGQIALDAARAEAAHKSARAKAILAYRASGSKSHVEAETRAEADDDVADLHLKRLTTAAIAEAARERLRQLRSQIDVGRSYVSTERAGDLLHTRGGP